MIDKEQLISYFARNLDIVKKQVAGLTQADSLLQLPFRGNCLNWVMGHLVENRNGILQTLGQAPIMSEAEARRYGYGSQPVTCQGEGVLRLEDLLARLENAQEPIAQALRRATAEDLARGISFAGRTMTVGERVFFQYFHETYHVGQTEVLRQLAGKDDKII